LEARMSDAHSPLPGKTFVGDLVAYIARVRWFRPVDWRVYFLWVGLMLGLLTMVGGFIVYGWWHGVIFPAYVWNVPLGTFTFVVAISIDTIGHRTVYRLDLESGEKLVHHITIAAGISSNVLLCLAYTYREFLAVPAICLTALSVFYSAIDEAMHWVRYTQGKSDRIEMWSHFFIFVGHTIMMVAWVYWFWQGYPGVKETLEALYGN
jgi:hypothetical protein